MRVETNGKLLCLACHDDIKAAKAIFFETKMFSISENIITHKIISQLTIAEDERERGREKTDVLEALGERKARTPSLKLK